MNAKAMNPLERHVEKIALALAGAGLIYLGYLAWQPVVASENGMPIDDGGKPVPAEDIEARLGDRTGREPRSYLQKLLDTQAKNEHEIQAYKVSVPTYATNYANIIGREPLPREVASLTAPMIGPPAGIAPVRGPNDGSDNGPVWTVVTPDPVAPLNGAFKLELFQHPVAVGVPNVGAGAPAGNPGAGGAALALAVRDQNAVAVQGFLPVGLMLVQMAKQTTHDKTRLPDELQRAEIYHIHVLRREKLNNAWTADWKEVPPTKAAPALPEITWATVSSRADLISKMNEVASHFPSIVLPNFYQDEKGALIMPSDAGMVGASIDPSPVSGGGGAASQAASRPKAVLDTEAAILRDLKLLQSNPGTPGSSGTGLPHYDSNGIPQSGESSPGTPAGGPESIPADMLAAKKSLVVPFCFWDETVLPDHEYQYRIQVDFVNPTYNWENGMKKPELKNKPILAADPVVIPFSIKVPADLLLFVNSIDEHFNPSFEIFKQSGGKWYKQFITPRLGMEISGGGFTQDGKQIDIETGLRVVDVDHTTKDAQVVLIDQAGKMFVRDVNADTSHLNTEKSEWDKTSEQLTSVPVSSRPSTSTAPGRRGG